MNTKNSLIASKNLTINSTATWLASRRFQLHENSTRYVGKIWRQWGLL